MVGDSDSRAAPADSDEAGGRRPPAGVYAARGGAGICALRLQPGSQHRAEGDPTVLSIGSAGRGRWGFRTPLSSPGDVGFVF